MDVFLLVLGGMVVIPGLVAGAATLLVLELWRDTAAQGELVLPILFVVFGSIFIAITLRRSKKLREDTGRPKSILERLVWGAPFLAIPSIIAGLWFVLDLDADNMKSLRRSAATACTDVFRTSKATIDATCIDAALRCRTEVRRADVPLVMQKGARAECLKKWGEARGFLKRPEPATP